MILMCHHWRVSVIKIMHIAGLISSPSIMGKNITKCFFFSPSKCRSYLSLSPADTSSFQSALHWISQRNKLSLRTAGSLGLWCWCSTRLPVVSVSTIAAGVEPAQGSFKATLSAYLPLITNMFLLWAHQWCSDAAEIDKHRQAEVSWCRI